MESEKRSSRRSGSEYFICFTARNSSSMKMSSKSMQSPGRRSGKFGESSLSSSLSRRLRSRSVKGSPMFPAGSQKKKGSSLETTTAEPSSPKVTCIGQVRVKTKKQGQKFRRRSKRKGDLSFRKTEQNHHQQPQQPQECLPHRNQRWVHLPLSICEAFKTFGAEFSCLLPCTKSNSCLSGEKSDHKKINGRQTAERNTSSCREVFANWVMTSVHENEKNMDNNDHEMELVVSRREDEMRRVRREEMVGEIQMQILEEKRVSFCRSEIEEEVEEEEEGRVSICIPPKNALLLMRCRSEPFRNSALANRFWESPINNKEEDEENHRQREAIIVAEEDDSKSDDEEEEVEDDSDDELEDEKEVKLELEEEFCKPPEKEENADISLEEHHEEKNQDIGEELEVIKTEDVEEVIDDRYSAIEPLGEVDILKTEECEEQPILLAKEQELILELNEEQLESRRPSISSRRVSFSSCTKSIHEDEEPEQHPEQVKMAVFEEKVKEDKVAEPRISVEKKETMEINKQEDEEVVEEELKSKERENGDDELPDCLLLMMCEPKLSMEVSKETWVCSTDFIRVRPERKLVQNNGGDHDQSKKRNSTDSKSRLSTDSKSRLSTDSNPGRPPLHSKHQKPPTPPRRSISKPTPPPPAKVAPSVEVSTSPTSMATMIEQKFVQAVAYEPFVLTRCKSEPLRSSAKLAPEACFWKNMKLEPHTQGPPGLGVGAATGIGF